MCSAWFELAKRSVLLLALLLLYGCGGSGAHDHSPADRDYPAYAGDYPIDIVCTTGQVAEMIERVGGEHVEVVALMGHDVDPHSFQPQFADVERLASADAIFYNGLHLEGRMSDLFEQRARTKPTYAVTAGLVQRGDHRLRQPPEFEGMYDPHVWHDVKLWADCAHDVADMLGKLDPPHAADYDKNAHAYMDELAELDLFCREQIATIPESVRVLVTAHDAFGYFGKAYGLEVVGLKGISTEEEKDLAHQEHVQNLIIERKIPAVFVESTVAHRTVEALIEPCRAAGWDVKNGGELFSDALGAAASPEATYTGMIRHNVQTIVEALTANAESVGESSWE